MRMGDWIMFRGRRRFVIGVRGGGLLLERVTECHKYQSPYVFYNCSRREKATMKVVKASTVRARQRARQLLEQDLMPWTTIEWNGDDPVYIHDETKFPSYEAG